MKMSKLLVSGLWTLLCLSIVNAIWCNKCRKLVFANLCRDSEEYCWVDRSGGCYTKNIFAKYRIIRTDVGCASPCTDFTEPNRFSKWTQYFCCFRDYCN